MPLKFSAALKTASDPRKWRQSRGRNLGVHNFGKFGGGMAAVVALSHQTGALAELQIDFLVRNKHIFCLLHPAAL